MLVAVEWLRMKEANYWKQKTWFCFKQSELSEVKILRAEKYSQRNMLNRFYVLFFFENFPAFKRTHFVLKASI